MTDNESRVPRAGVVAIVGATATGKTKLGVNLALRFGGEIVNADSRLFYRGMDVGTAKPSLNERRGVTHHLIDTLDPRDNYSLSDFLQSATSVIAGVRRRGKLPIVVGGSGQYIWGLLEGWEVPNIPPDESLRNELEKQLESDGIESLRDRLRSTGARGIDRVEMLNPRRLIRAIERAVATGDAMGGAGKSSEPPFDTLVIGLTAPREVLHVRVTTRVDDMLEAGWLDEVKALRSRGVSREMPSMSAIGYRQLVDYDDGCESWESIREEILIGNRRLIGAQNNWFKARDERISWFDITSVNFECAVFGAVAEWLRNRGKTSGYG